MFCHGLFSLSAEELGDGVLVQLVTDDAQPPRHTGAAAADVVIPINKSPITTVCILNAIGCWNSFMWPLLVTNSKEMRVLSYGLMQFQTENGSSYELIMAASCILVLPIVVVYLILRKYVIEGVTQSGIKG